MASHIMLIPKIDEPTVPKEFKPITVGNVMYRLLMKIVAGRLQKHMGNIISRSQTAFLKGRSISDNELVREVLHSFGSIEYKEEAFLLKADIAKAFDTVRWSFVWEAMKAVHIPTKMIDMVQTCIEDIHVTVLVNGQGDGFLKPNRGLRQGCPLSPYLFILAMECLPKRFQLAVEEGVIKGIRTAPILTHSIYADDLVVMERATQQEAVAYKEMFDDFAIYSGLSINPEKSTIWLSKRCGEERKEEIL